MQIVPVIDLLYGQVVRGVAGRRAEYRPLVSRACPSSAPLAVARSLRERFAFRTLYLADLDAIGGGEPAWELYRALLAEGWQLWIDAGLSTAERARQLAEFRVGANAIERLIVGLESLASPAGLSELLTTIGAERAVFSLDLQQGLPLTTIEAWRSLPPLEIARATLALGVQRWIVLDLAGVGVGAGIPTLALCRALRTLAPQSEIITGGGVRDADDLRSAADAGCDRLLIASALHDGRLTVADLALRYSARPGYDG